MKKLIEIKDLIRIDYKAYESSLQNDDYGYVSGEDLIPWDSEEGEALQVWTDHKGREYGDPHYGCDCDCDDYCECDCVIKCDCDSDCDCSFKYDYSRETMRVQDGYIETEIEYGYYFVDAGAIFYEVFKDDRFYSGWCCSVPGGGCSSCGSPRFYTVVDKDSDSYSEENEGVIYLN
jgi:hypothetical protein